ncbi:hypothetical protein J3459_010528 [Metarhizium acridum]|nr:hypothetical protein J3459_010528 [Metarhizium acridum]
MNGLPVLFLLAGRAVAADDDLSDFTNNVAQDLGPLLALFGEAVTKQYLSESTTFLDYFTFAMNPLGIITAVVSVIRVCGHPSLRAFIGRSQEGEAAVEAELCASTSRDVCELFHRGGIARVLGRQPDVLELVAISSPGGRRTSRSTSATRTRPRTGGAVGEAQAVGVSLAALNGLVLQAGIIHPGRVRGVAARLEQVPS